MQHFKRCHVGCAARACVSAGRLLRGRPSCYHNNAPPGNSDAADLINAYQFLHQDMQEVGARTAQSSGGSDKIENDGKIENTGEKGGTQKGRRGKRGGEER